MAMSWNAENLQELARGFQEPCVLAAAVSLGVFPALAGGPRTAQLLAEQLDASRRALTVLLDALVAMDLLDKRSDQYSLPPALRSLVTEGARGSVLAGLRHLAFLLPRWAALSEVVRTGVAITRNEDYTPDPRALEAFIEAMHVFAAPGAGELVKSIPLEGRKKLLDVGGGPGTYTIAFLKANPALKAVLFDRPQVVEIARRHLAEARLLDRTDLVAGDFYEDSLPGGCDAAWVSAIIHQNSRAQNRELFGKLFQAMAPGGAVFVRDHVMDESRTSPASGALFAVNMLVGTEGGGTYTYDEIRQDLHAAGFTDVQLLESRAEMNCLVRAAKSGP